MSPSVKRLLSIAVVAAAAMAIHFFCVKPLMCGIAEKRLERITLRLAHRPDSYALRRQAAANLDAAVACIRVQPDNVNLYMIAAANCRLLGQPRQAIGFYEQALHYDRRRELFANLGNVQSEIGMKNEAIENLTRAAIFWGRETYVLGFTRRQALMRVPDRLARAHLKRQVPDPELREKLTPE
ncbi:MAG: hypothetical protein ACXW2F_10490, partial [Thermoanaerobaculia bacterium]